MDETKSAPTKRIKGRGLHGYPMHNQAQKIIAKFGGEAWLAKLLDINRITCYRWGYAKPYGTGGLIPSSMVEEVQRVARLEGIVLTDADWRPERIDYSVESDSEGGSHD